MFRGGARILVIGSSISETQNKSLLRQKLLHNVANDTHDSGKGFKSFGMKHFQNLPGRIAARCEGSVETKMTRCFLLLHNRTGQTSVFFGDESAPL